MRDAFPAVALILIGGIFLAVNLGVLSWGGNWWALFLLIPILFFVIKLAEIRKRGEKVMTREHTGPVLGLIFMSLSMCVFLFNLDWGDMWPVFMIALGVGFLLTHRQPSSGL
jgi:hypothetical protein